MAESFRGYLGGLWDQVESSSRDLWCMAMLRVDLINNVSITLEKRCFYTHHLFVIFHIA